MDAHPPALNAWSPECLVGFYLHLCKQGHFLSEELSSEGALSGSPGFLFW